MKIARIELTNFRNICQAELEPEDGLTVIFGKNGQGKTNLLEAIWLLTGANSSFVKESREKPNDIGRYYTGFVFEFY